MSEKNDQPEEALGIWGKLDILLKPLGGLLAALTVAGIGFFGSGYLEKRQNEEMRTRLYTELITRREEAESNLRKDMFSKIMDQFLGKDEKHMELEEKILNLELLAYNFHESLNLKPLFMHLISRVRDSIEPDIDSLDHLKRLRRMAKEINYKQVTSLGNHGADNRVEFFCPDSIMNLTGEAIQIYDTSLWVEVDSIIRRVYLTVMAANSDRQEIEISMQVNTPYGCKASRDFIEEYKAFRHPWDSSGFVRPNMYDYLVQNDCEFYTPDSMGEVSANFGVGFFDFPMIDNSRLKLKDHRLAFVLMDWNCDKYKDGAQIALEIICFPGCYASLKERPYFDDIVNKLMAGKKD